MRVALAMLRASWLSATSYRLGMAFSILALLFTVVPVYFVSRALQPLAAGAIRNEGGQYFAFVVVGLATFTFVTVAVTTLPGAFGGGISSGSLEAVLSTPARLPAVIAGMTSYGLMWSGVKGLLLLAAAWVLGAPVAWALLPAAVGILLLIVLAYLSVGLVGAALVLAFRTTGPLLQGVLVASAFLGGVYYPTKVIPSWIQALSAAVPLTYGLRALRRVLLERAPLSVVLPDLLILAGFVVVLLSLSALALAAALRYARRAGTLAQY